MKRFLRYFGKPAAQAPKAPPPVVLKNKQWGLAWLNLKGISDDLRGTGIETLHGHVVMTVCISHSAQWIVDPPQRFLVQRDCHLSWDKPALPGDVASLLTISDDHLIPFDEASECESFTLEQPNKETT